jgi:LuxR family transcriptional regulator, maltose regulon positive regulatory protein
MTGDVEGTIAHARRVLDLAEEDDHLVRGSAAGLLGLAHWSRGDLGTAHRWWTDSRDELARAGHASDTLGVSIALGDIATAQGRLREAMTTYERGLATGSAHGPSALRGTADMHVGLSEVFRERDDLDSARHHLAASAELGDAAGLPQNRHRWRVASARLRQVEGDLDGAVGLLDEAERLYVSDLFPDVRPIAALRARVWLAQGRVAQVLAWARERGLSAEDELSYLREFEHVTLARALLAHASATRDAAALARAAWFVDRLLLAAREGDRAGSVLELRVLRALAARAGGDVDGAVAATGQALSLAEPEGSARVFLDEGPAMVSLLRAAAREGPAAGYASRLLVPAGPADDGAGTRQRKQQLVEPLSARELEVLRLLATDLDGPAIARELYLSLNTVRTHTRHVYAKLGVTSRRAAVRRAADLDLLSRAPGR